MKNSEEVQLADTAASALVGDYLKYIAHLDVPLSAKIEMISVMRQIMSSFVDRAFGDDPVQHVNGIHPSDEIIDSPVVASSSDHQPTDSLRLSSAFTPPAAARRREERP